VITAIVRNGEDADVRRPGPLVRRLPADLPVRRRIRLVVKANARTYWKDRLK
jgi:hypothetical protein